MKIIGAASAFPDNYYSQEVLCSALSEYWRDQIDSPQLLARLHARACVDGRHLSLPLAEYYNLATWGDANRAWFDTAAELGSRSLCRAVTRAGVDRRSLGALIFMSITGVASPSVDAA